MSKKSIPPKAGAGAGDHDRALARFYAAWRQLRRGPAVKVIERSSRSTLDKALNMSEIDVLIELNRSAEGIAIGELAASLMTDQGNTSATVTRLQRTGHVTRTAGSDGRVTLVQATDAGRAAIENILKRREDMFQAAFFDWSGEELDDFLSDMELAIERIIGSIEPEAE